MAIIICVILYAVFHNMPLSDEANAGRERATYLSHSFSRPIKK